MLESQDDILSSKRHISDMALLSSTDEMMAEGTEKLEKQSFSLDNNFTQTDGLKHYESRDELEPLTDGNPLKKFKAAIDRLTTSKDWNLQFDACNIVRRVCKFHQDLVLQNGATLVSLIKQLSKLADSLRSSVARIALITISDMFAYLKRCMEAFLDPLIKVLLKRGADTSNAFISDEASRALQSMTENC